MSNCQHKFYTCSFIGQVSFCRDCDGGNNYQERQRMKHPLFEFIKASPFFQVYAPDVMNWKHKMRGTDGNQKDISFSESDLKQIRAGLTKLFKDLKEIK
jgi:hypothetical protein